MLIAIVADSVDGDHHKPAVEDAEQEERVIDRIARAGEIHFLLGQLRCGLAVLLQFFDLFLECDLPQAVCDEKQN